MNELCKLCSKYGIYIEFTSDKVILKKFYFEGDDLKIFKKDYYITEDIEDTVNSFINECLERSI